MFMLLHDIEHWTVIKVTFCNSRDKHSEIYGINGDGKESGGGRKG